MKQRIINWLKFDPLFIINSSIFFVVLNQAHKYLFVRLDQHEYFEPIFVDNLVSQVPWFFVLVVVLLVANYLPISWNVLRGKWSWQAIDQTGRLRVVGMIVALTLVWAYSAYSYNFYYDQPHYLERLLLVLLFIGCWFSPVFVGPLVVLTFTISGQMTYPEEIAYSDTDKRMIFRFLLLFAFYVYLHPIIRPKPATFIFVTLCLVGAYYFYPAVAKIAYGTEELSWVMDNDLHNLFLSSYLNGWLSFLPFETAYSIRNALEAIRIPLQIITLITELAGIVLVLFNRRIAMMILASAICMHLGIFVSSGVFFWKWIALDAVLIWYLWKSRDDKAINAIFRPAYAALSIFIIGYANFFGAKNLGWWDGPVNNYFEYEVIDTQGNSYEFARSFAQPYDFRTTQSRTYFLVNDKLLANTYGTLESTKTYSQLRESTIENLDQILINRGRKSYDTEQVDNFSDFLVRYFSGYNRQLNQVFVPAILRPPMHIWTIPRPNAYNHEYPIQIVKVWLIETYDTGTEVITTRNEVVLEVEIPQDDFLTLQDTVYPHDHVIAFTDVTYASIQSEYGAIESKYLEDEFGISVSYIPSHYDKRDQLEAYIWDWVSTPPRLLLTYHPTNLPENLDIVTNFIEQSYNDCGIVMDESTVFAQQYVHSALSCNYEPKPIEYDNGIMILDTFINYNDQSESIEVVTGWQVDDTSLLDEYNVSIQIITPDWQNVGQIDRHLYNDILKWYRVELSTANLPAGDYRVMVIVYRDDTGEQVTGTDLTTGETGTILPLGVVILTDN